MAILKPFNDATEVVSGEKYPTISIITPLIHKLLNVLKATSEDSTLTKQIKSTIHQDLQCRYQSHVLQQTLRLAAFLDPRFKTVRFLEEDERDEVERYAGHQLVKIIVEKEAESTGAEYSTSEPYPPPPTKKKQLEVRLAVLRDLLWRNVMTMNLDGTRLKTPLLLIPMNLSSGGRTEQFTTSTFQCWLEKRSV